MSSRLMPPKVGSSSWQTRITSSGFCGVDFEVEDVDVGEALEQDALAFHDGFAGQRPDVSQAQDRGAVGDDGHQVAAGRVLEGIMRVLLDFQARLGHARGVGQAQIALGLARLGGNDFDFSGTAP